MKTKVLFTTLFLFALGALVATPPQWAWFQKTEGDGACNTYALTSNSQNRIIVAGCFSGTVSFGTQTLISQGGLDAWVAQLDDGGNWLWARSMGGTDDDWASELCVDAQDNIYVGGCYRQSIIIGASTLTSLGDKDIFCVKYSGSGDVLDAKSLGSPEPDMLQGLAITPQGQVYIGGEFMHTITIGDTVLNTPGYNLFVAKLDSQLEPLWAQRTYSSGSAYPPELQGLGVDTAGNCYAIGNFFNQFSIGSPSPVAVVNSNVSGFVAKLSPAGNGLWAERIGEAYTAVEDCYTDISGNTYVTCDIAGILDSDTPRLNPRPLCGKINANGTWVWYIDYDELDGCVSNKICGDNAGNAYQTGILWASFTFGDYTLTGDLDTSNVYVVKANPAGNWQWGLQTRDAEMMFNMNVHDITALNNGDCVIAGTNISEQLHFGHFLMPPAQSAYTFLVRVNGEGSANSDVIANPAPVAVSVYPNPSKSSTCFQIMSKFGSAASASIYNIKGQVVKSFPIGAIDKQGNLVWDGKDEKDHSCAAGVYFLKLDMGKESVSKRFSRVN